MQLTSTPAAVEPSRGCKFSDRRPSVLPAADAEVLHVGNRAFDDFALGTDRALSMRRA